MSRIELQWSARIYVVRDWLRELGARYDSDRRVWSLPAENEAEARRIINDPSIGAKPQPARAGAVSAPVPDLMPFAEEPEEFRLMPAMPNSEEPSLKPRVEVDVPYTSQQLAIFNAYADTGESIIAAAGAGSGKTTTVLGLALRNPQHRFLYLCFNRKNADEAREKFPANVLVKTAHGLAWQELGLGRYPHKTNSSVNQQEVFAQICGRGTVFVPGVDARRYVDLLREVVKEFENSLDEEITINPEGSTATLVSAVMIAESRDPDFFIKEQERVIEAAAAKTPSIRQTYPELMDMLVSIRTDRRRNSLASLRTINQKALRVFVEYYRFNDPAVRKRLSKFLDQMEGHAREYWKRMADMESDVPIGHNAYLKVYQLSKPVIKGFQAILFDECQDANPVILDIVNRQAIRKIWVGDRHQAIYAFNGAVNTIEDLLAGGTRMLPLTDSFRFGPNVAAVANRILSLKRHFFPEKYPAGSLHLLTGVGGKAEGDRQAILCRTNAGVLDEALACINAGKEVYYGDCLDKKFFETMADIYDLSKEKKLRWNSPYKDYGSISELKYEAGLRGDIETTRAVALLEKLGADQFNSAIASLRAAPNRPSAMVHVLTSHKAKGMEWPHVKICDEFRTVFFNRKGYLKKEIQEEELNLLYVSVTRAQLTVSIPDAISEILNHKTKPAEDRVYEECAERSL